jgi:Major Facilitator Superfamily
MVGWRGALAALGLINFLFAFLFAALWREPSSNMADHVDRLEGKSASDSLNIWELLPVSCATALYLIGQMVVITYVPLYLKDAMGLSPYWASQTLALTQAGAMFGRIGWGVASDRLFVGRRRVVLNYYRFVVGGVDRRVELDERRFPLLSPAANSLCRRGFHRRLPRSLLRAHRRDCRQVEDRSRFGDDDHDQRRRGDFGYTDVRVYRGLHRFLRSRMASAGGDDCHRRRWAGALPQRVSTNGLKRCSRRTHYHLTRS